jgi:hypothetical protein
MDAGAAAAVALYRYPFAGILIWLLLFPFFLSGSTQLYWVFHRLLIPGTLALVVIARTRHQRPQARIFIEPAEWAMPIFILVALVNIVILSPDQADGLAHLYDRFVIPFSMYWLIRFIAPGRRELRLLAVAAIAVIASQVLIGALGWVAPSLLPADWVDLVGFRTVGSWATWLSFERCSCAARSCCSTGTWRARRRIATSSPSRLRRCSSCSPSRAAGWRLRSCWASSCSSTRAGSSHRGPLVIVAGILARPSCRHRSGSPSSAWAKENARRASSATSHPADDRARAVLRVRL